jgi:hypothetical protein
MARGDLRQHRMASCPGAASREVAFHRFRGTRDNGYSRSLMISKCALSAFLSRTVVGGPVTRINALPADGA